MAFAQALLGCPVPRRCRGAGSFLWVGKVKEPKKADPDGSARCAGARACAGRADGHPWPAARERVHHAHPAGGSRAVPPLPRRGRKIMSTRATRAVALDVALDVDSVGPRRAAQPGARERRACSRPWMGEFALGAAHALRPAPGRRGPGLAAKQDAKAAKAHGEQRRARRRQASSARGRSREPCDLQRRMRATSHRARSTAQAVARNQETLRVAAQQPAFTRGTP